MGIKSQKKKVDAVVLLVHGIGSSDSSIQKNWERLTAQLHQSFETGDSPFHKVHTAPINWIEHYEKDRDRSLQRVAPDSGAEPRALVGSLFSECLQYTSEERRSNMMKIISGLLLKKYQEFREIMDNDVQDVVFAVVAHSLGSMLMFHLVMELYFPVHLLINLGSPLPAVLTARDPDLINTGVHIRPDVVFANVFHPLDPLAFRIEPLIYPSMDLPPPVRVDSSIPRKIPPRPFDVSIDHLALSSWRPQGEEKLLKLSSYSALALQYNESRCDSTLESIIKSSEILAAKSENQKILSCWLESDNKKAISCDIAGRTNQSLIKKAVYDETKINTHLISSAGSKESKEEIKKANSKISELTQYKAWGGLIPSSFISNFSSDISDLESIQANRLHIDQKKNYDITAICDFTKKNLDKPIVNIEKELSSWSNATKKISSCSSRWDVAFWALTERTSVDPTIGNILRSLSPSTSVYYSSDDLRKAKLLINVKDSVGSEKLVSPEKLDCDTLDDSNMKEELQTGGVSRVQTAWIQTTSFISAAAESLMGQRDLKAKTLNNLPGASTQNTFASSPTAYQPIRILTPIDTTHELNCSNTTKAVTWHELLSGSEVYKSLSASFSLTGVLDNEIKSKFLETLKLNQKSPCYLTSSSSMVMDNIQGKFKYLNKMKRENKYAKRNKYFDNKHIIALIRNQTISNLKKRYNLKNTVLKLHNEKKSNQFSSFRGQQSTRFLTSTLRWNVDDLYELGYDPSLKVLHSFQNDIKYNSNKIKKLNNISSAMQRNESDIVHIRKPSTNDDMNIDSEISSVESGYKCTPQYYLRLSSLTNQSLKEKLPENSRPKLASSSHRKKASQSSILKSKHDKLYIHSSKSHRDGMNKLYNENYLNRIENFKHENESDNLALNEYNSYQYIKQTKKRPPKISKYHRNIIEFDKNINIAQANRNKLLILEIPDPLLTSMSQFNQSWLPFEPKNRNLQIIHFSSLPKYIQSNDKTNFDNSLVSHNLSKSLKYTSSIKKDTTKDDKNMETDSYIFRNFNKSIFDGSKEIIDEQSCKKGVIFQSRDTPNSNKNAIAKARHVDVKKESVTSKRSDFLKNKVSMQELDENQQKNKYSTTLHENEIINENTKKKYNFMELNSGKNQKLVDIEHQISTKESFYLHTNFNDVNQNHEEIFSKNISHDNSEYLTKQNQNDIVKDSLLNLSTEDILCNLEIAIQKRNTNFQNSKHNKYFTTRSKRAIEFHKHNISITSNDNETLKVVLSDNLNKKPEEPKNFKYSKINKKSSPSIENDLNFTLGSYTVSEKQQLDFIERPSKTDILFNYDNESCTISNIDDGLEKNLNSEYNKPTTAQNKTSSKSKNLSKSQNFISPTVRSNAEQNKNLSNISDNVEQLTINESTIGKLREAAESILPDTQASNTELEFLPRYDYVLPESAADTFRTWGGIWTAIATHEGYWRSKSVANFIHDELIYCHSLLQNSSLQQLS